MKRSRLLTMDQLIEAGACQKELDRIKGLLPITVTVRRAGEFARKDHAAWMIGVDWAADHLLNAVHREEFDTRFSEMAKAEESLRGGTFAATIRENDIELIKLFARHYIKEGQ